MSDVEIRQAPASLKPQIIELARATMDEHRARHPWAFPNNAFDIVLLPSIEAAFPSIWSAETTSPNLFAAYLDGEFLGYVLLSTWARTEPLAWPQVNIEDICVVPKARGQGVATALVAHVKSLSEDRDWDNLTASVWASNAASEALFQKSGFVPSSTQYRFGPNRTARDFPGRIGTGPAGLYVFGLVALGLIIALLVGLFGQ